MAAVQLRSTAFRREREALWRELEFIIKKADRSGLKSLNSNQLYRLPQPSLPQSIPGTTILPCYLTKRFTSLSLPRTGHKGALPRALFFMLHTPDKAHTALALRFFPLVLSSCEE